MTGGKSGIPHGVAALASRTSLEPKKDEKLGGSNKTGLPSPALWGLAISLLISCGALQLWETTTLPLSIQQTSRVLTSPASCWRRRISARHDTTSQRLTLCVFTLHDAARLQLALAARVCPCSFSLTIPRILKGTGSLSRRAADVN